MKKLLFLAFLLFIFTDESNACSCIGAQVPCESYWKASAVFLGTVTYGTTTTSKRGEDEFLSRVFRFTIDKAFRGVKGDEVEIRTGYGDGDCGYGFELGRQYLVYAYKDDTNKLVTGICSRTRPAAEADADLAYLRELSKAQPGGTIFGDVKFGRGEIRPNLTPLKGVKLLLAGPGKDYEAISDDKGTYKVSGLRPGPYRVSVEPPEGTSAHQLEQLVQVSAQGCTQVTFWLSPDTRVTGKVLDAHGLPASDVLMELMPLRGFARMFTRSSKDGSYELKFIQPGRYLLGVRIIGSAGSTFVPYPQTYYPGVSEESRATIITISEGQHFDANDLILPPRFIERQLNGIVLDASGQPVPGATVWLKEMQYKDADMPYSRETDKEGRFSYPVYEGIRYQLSASLELKEGERAEAENVEVVISSNPETIKLVLR